MYKPVKNTLPLVRNFKILFILNMGVTCEKNIHLICTCNIIPPKYGCINKNTLSDEEWVRNHDEHVDGTVRINLTWYSKQGDGG